VFAALILAGASFGAFNLATRMVEAQRREIGIGMALGMTTDRLAVRPLAIGAGIAVAGIGFGAAVALAVLWALRPVFESMLPLPEWHTPLQTSILLRGALISVVLPLLATSWPVWRAVRVMPIDAIGTAHRTAKGGLARLLRRFPWPTGAFHRMPVGNVLRTPRRTLLTALGIGAAVATLIAILGMIDSFVDTLDRNDRETLRGNADRLVVTLDGPTGDDGAEITRVRESPEVGALTPVVRFGGALTSGSPAEIEVLVEVLDMGNPTWAPSVTRGAMGPGDGGIVISDKAAADLGVDVGDTLMLEHPTVTADGLTTTTSRVRVAGVHPAPFRFQAYMDSSQMMPLFGRTEIANQLYVVPAEGSTPDDVKRALFLLPGVASVQPVAASSEVVRDALDEFTAIFRVIEVFIIVLALLIAYNASSINAEERARERATLFAFGLPGRRLLALEVVEGFLVGLVGTAIGLLLGGAVLRWVTTSTVGATMPDLDIHASISPATAVSAVVLGVVVVAAAPLLTLRRIRSMDIPGTLRVVE
jgi:putative ABC transport system permease protein